MQERAVLLVALCSLLLTERVVLQAEPQLVERVTEYRACASGSEIWVEHSEYYQVDGTGDLTRSSERVWERKTGPVEIPDLENRDPL